MYSFDASLSNISFTLELGSKLTPQDIKTLLELGLKDRRDYIRDGWSRIQAVRASFEEKITREGNRLNESATLDHPRLKAEIKKAFINKMSTLYP
jgi:hypothetical protein